MTNMAIVGGLFSALSVRLAGRRYAAWFASAAIVVYTLLVGTSAAVVRAAIMGLVAVWGRHFGRPYSAPNALFATALWMTAWNPHTLWDLGFLLSFAATCGLLLFATPAGRGFDALLARLFSARWGEFLSSLFFEPLVLTACCQLTTMPILWSHSSRISLVTLLTNALVLPLQTQVMAWGAAATLSGLLWLPLGRVLGWGAWLFLAGTIGAVESTARIPYAAIDVQPWAPAAIDVLIVLWYAAAGGGAWLLWQPPERRKAVRRAVQQAFAQAISGPRMTRLWVGGLVILAFLVWLAVASLPDGRLQVSFLGVDEGDATLIRTPGGQHILINGGSSPAQLTSHLGRRLPFWKRRLALVVLADSPARLAGVVPVLERYEVGQMLYAAASCRDAVCRELERLVQANGSAVQAPVDGLRVELDGLTLRVLRPGVDGSLENGSALFRLDYGNTCFLFAGRAQPEALRALASGGADLQCAVMQLDASAAETQEGAAFAQEVRPALAVLLGREDRAAAGFSFGAAVRYADRKQGLVVSSDGMQITLR